MIRFNVGNSMGVTSASLDLTSRRHQVIIESQSSSFFGIVISVSSNGLLYVISAGLDSVDRKSDAEIERWYLAWKESVELARCMQPASGSEAKRVRL